MFLKESGTKTDATVSNKYQIWLKNVFVAAKIQKEPQQVFCKRRPVTLLKKSRRLNIAKFLRTPNLKSICERLFLMWHIYRRKVIPNFCILLNLLVSSMLQALCYCWKSCNIKVVTFLSLRSYTHQVRCYHYFIVDIIVECVNLIQMAKLYHHDGEQLDFYKKKEHIETQSKQKDVLVIFTLQETKISNLFDKNCTQENIKYHIQHEESWLRWIAIVQVNYK